MKDKKEINEEGSNIDKAEIEFEEKEEKPKKLKFRSDPQMIIEF